MFDYLFYIRMALNVVFKWLALPHHILDVLGSNLSPDGGTPEGVLCFPQFLEGTAGIVP